MCPVCFHSTAKREETQESPHCRWSTDCETRTKYYNFNDAVKSILPYGEALQKTHPLDMNFCEIYEQASS